MSTAKDYQPVGRSDHSTVKVGDYLYMWGGLQPGLPEVHDSEKKKSMCPVMEVCHLASGRWEQKPTTGTPPLGVVGYAAAIGNEIFYYGGYCNHKNCFHNSLHSFNVDTFHWKELSPTTPHHGPMMKGYCGMVAVQLDGEDYLVVIGGRGLSSNTPTQAGAQYDAVLGSKRCNEIHYYKLSSGEWIIPTVTGDRPPPIDDFTLTSVTNNYAILFGGYITSGVSNNVYIIDFAKTSMNCTMLSNPGGSVQWPKRRWGHSSVLINNSTGPHLLVVGGWGTNDSWLFDINKQIWKQLLNIPNTVTRRRYHSLLVWSVTPTTNWIIVFGGQEVEYTDTQVIELRYTSDNEWSTSEIPLDQYQEMLRIRRKEALEGALGQWMEEGSVDLTITRVNMLGAPGAGKTCAEHLLLNEDPPSDDVSTPIACPTVRATRVAVEDKTKLKRVTNDDLLDALAADLTTSAYKDQEILIEAAPKIRSTKSADHAQSSDPDISHVPPSTDQPSFDTIVKEHQATPPNYRSEAIVQKILSTPPKGIRLSDHWLYIIDSGGQPAYQELLPLFTRAASLNIITLDLSKPFKDKFTLEYRIGGECFPCHSKSTQLAIFQSAVSTGANFKPLDISHVTRKPMHSMHLILGTHYDELKDPTHELGKYEGILKSSMPSLQPYLRTCIIRKPDESIIFPVNTISKSEERKEYSQMICQAIYFKGSGASLTIKMPIRWFAFELALPNKSIIPIGEAFSIGERYGMNEEEAKQALRYFHDVGLKLYYPEVTGVVFIDPQPILKILSQLLALTYVNNINCLELILIERLPQIVTDYLKEGFFNENIFRHLKSAAKVFSQSQFQLPNLVELLLHLHIITKVVDNHMGRYFIPYALPSYDDLVTPKMKDTDAKPLLIVWRTQNRKCKQILPVPQGIFPLTIIYLLNQEQFEIPPSAPDFFKYRDAMSIRITFIQQHTLHIINRYTHIEVYFTGPLKHCPQVRQLVIKAIDCSTEKMHMEHNHVTAFSCPIKVENCYCIVDEAQKVVNCTMCAQSPDTIDDHYWCWFKSSGYTSDNEWSTSEIPLYQYQEELRKRREEALEGNYAGKVFSDISEESNGSGIPKQILKKPPNFSDITLLFIPYAHQYHIIGSALNVGIEDLIASPLAAEFKVILLFHRWIASNKEVTWKKMIQVCQYYPNELGKAEAELITFLSSERARESTTTTSSSFPRGVRASNISDASGSAKQKRRRLLDIRDLDIVIKELTSTQHLSCAVWHKLGLQLGLYEPTLVDIEADHRGISANCFRACMAAWLRGEDKVKDKDGPTWLSLVLALETLEINSIATNIKQKYC